MALSNQRKRGKDTSRNHRIPMELMANDLGAQPPPFDCEKFVTDDYALRLSVEYILADFDVTWSTVC